MKLSDEFKNELCNLAPYIAKYIVNLNMSNVKFNFNKKMIASTYAIKNANNVKDVMEFELKYFEDPNAVGIYTEDLTPSKCVTEKDAVKYILYWYIKDIFGYSISHDVSDDVNKYIFNNLKYNEDGTIWSNKRNIVK